MRLGRVLLTDRASVADLLVLAGFATLIVRSRFKELTPEGEKDGTHRAGME
jgi:hypothetical protein